MPASRTPQDPNERGAGIPVHELLHEDRASVWMLTTGPTVWAVHFLVCYVTAAVWCAKAALPAAPLDGVRVVLGGITVVALLLIAWFGWRGLRQHRFETATLPHDAPTAGDRHRFLGFATMLLCGLSFVAVVYVAFVLVIIGTCQ
jgi:hypothetical protein